MTMGFDDLGPFVRRVVGQEMSRRRAIAEVVSKSGTQVIVQRLGASVTEGPYATLAGVSGFVLVGDRVPLVEEGGTFIVGMPVEGSDRSNVMQIVGADPVARRTTSPSTFVELNRVDGLAIAGPGFVIIHWICNAERVAPEGPGDMEVRFKVNNTLPTLGSAGVFNVGPTAPATSKTTSFPLWIGSYTTSPMTYQERFFATFIQATVLGVLTGIETIESVSVEARTLDTVNLNDYVEGQHLRVFA